LNMEFVCKNLFPFPLAAAKLKVWTIRQSLWQNVTWRCNCANILAHLVDFNARWTPPPLKKNPQNLCCLHVHPASLIRLAYQDIN
jgi:hypothetical protein